MGDAPTVLVCDDEAAIRCVVSARLRAAGLQVVEASDGAEGLEAVGATNFDLVISDLQMPRMNGLDLCRALRAQPRTERLRAVLLTARGHLLRKEDLSNTNIVQMVPKPFSARELTELVVSLLRGEGQTAVAPTAPSLGNELPAKRAA